MIKADLSLSLIEHKSAQREVRRHLFILDKSQIDEAGEKLLAYMGQSLRALDESLGNRLHIIEGDQVEVLTDLMKLYGATEVHISDEYERYGAARDARVEAAGIKLVRTGSPYAVAPGRVVKPSDATPYRVYRCWQPTVRVPVFRSIWAPV